MNWGNAGLIAIGFSLALVFITLYGRLFAKKEIEENDEGKRHTEMMAAQRQMWIEEVRKVRIGLAAMTRVRFELYNASHDLERCRLESGKIIDEAMLYMCPPDTVTEPIKETL
jgi:hypothetical protein